MILRAANVTGFSQEMARAFSAGQPVEQVDLSPLHEILEHNPEDLTVTVQTGITLANLQAKLKARRQWLPIDPPQSDATIADVLHQNLSGPRRYGFGTIREHVLGLTAVLSDGRVMHSGGKVVKNVAGYDLCKLLVGSYGTLGVCLEATFKLLPLPEKEVFLARPCPTIAEALQIVERSQPLAPVILDLHNLSRTAYAVVVGFCGVQEDVAWQTEQIRQLGFSAEANLDYARSAIGPEVICHSILPSRLAALLESLQNTPFVARAGNGVVYAQGGPPPSSARVPIELNRRVKDLFDPKGILPAMPW